LRALDASPSLDPCLIIAHGSRCGSTWLTGMLRAMDGALTIAEPGCLVALLSHDIRGRSAFIGHEVLRQMVRALGRIRFGDERRYVLKLSSTLTRFFPQFRRAFPGVPVIWLQRRPSEIVESNLHAPGNWVEFDRHGDEQLARLTLHKMAMLFLAASGLVDDNTLVLDYRDLPEAAWTHVAPFIGVSLNECERDRMRDIARIDAKSAKLFVPRRPRELAAPVQAAIRQALDPLYEALDRRRVAG
jgi:hypothetical protein